MSDSIEVLITLPFPDRLVTRLRKISPRLHITVQKANKFEDIPEETWKRTQVLYTARVFPESSEEAPNLKWIQFHWAGIDHILDSPLLQNTNIAITTLSGSNASQVSEHILMMLLAFGHHLPEALEFQRKSEWPQDRWERFSPREVRGSTVGIVGYGSIGRQLARLLSPFDATVLASKRNAKQPQDADYIPEGQGDPLDAQGMRFYLHIRSENRANHKFDWRLGIRSHEIGGFFDRRLTRRRDRPQSPGGFTKRSQTCRRSSRRLPGGAASRR